MNKRKKIKSKISGTIPILDTDPDAFEIPFDQLTDYEKIQREFQRQKAINAHFAVPGPLNFVIVLDHLKANFNIGKLFRSAEVFGCQCVHVVGTKEFNPYPSKGGFRHVPAKFFHTFQESYDELIAKGFTIYLLEPEAPDFLGSIVLAEKSAFVIGHEMRGITFDKTQFQGLQSLQIRQLGKTQSLNAAVAGSLAMYEYSRQRPPALG